MKCTFYLDRPYHPEIDSEIIKKELVLAKEKKKTLAIKYFNPKPTSIYIYFSPDKNTRLKYRTSIKILARHWDFKEGMVKPTSPGSIALNSDLNKLSTKIINAASIAKDVSSLVSKNDYKKLLAESVDEKNIDPNSNKLDQLIEEFKAHKTIYTTEGTMKEYNTVFIALNDFQEKKKLSLSLADFNTEFYVQFENFLSKKKNPLDKERGLLNDTIYKYISTLRVFLTWCNDNGNAVHPDTFKPHKSSFKKKAHNEIVVLTEDELTRLRDHDLSGHPSYERVRDLFCFACYTGQRFSDIMRFSKADFQDNKWVFLSAKTKKKVIVPFNGFIENGLEILEKYNFELPEISNQKFNDYIKEVGILAKIDTPVRIIRFNGKKEIIIEKPKHDFMSSHMGRRTAVTILLSRGVPINLVQKITQHSDIRTLMKYESAGTDSLIDALNKF